MGTLHWSAFEEELEARRPDFTGAWEQLKARPDYLTAVMQSLTSLWAWSHVEDEGHGKALEMRWANEDA